MVFELPDSVELGKAHKNQIKKVRKMKVIRSALLLFALSLLAPLTSAVTYDDNIVAIFGSGNPDTGWTSEQGSNGIEVAMRGKHRVTASTANVNGTYSFPTGLQPATTRAIWNWEFSINSGSVKLDAYDYYLSMAHYTDVEANFLTFDVMVIPDNSYGDDTTVNGAGVEGLSSVYASQYNVAQQSHNITFYGGLNPDPDANGIYEYELYAVAKGAGVDADKLVSVSISVIVGTGASDTDADGVPNIVDACATTASGQTVNADGCSIQDLVDNCAINVETHGQYVECVAHLAKQLSDAGIITNKQRQEWVVAAAKSDIGN